MSRAATAGSDRLLHCSPQRTVFLAADPSTGDPVVRKVFASGSLADAERECALGRLCAGPAVVEYRESGLDPATNRPSVTTTYQPGTDLDHLVAEHGALPAALACRLLAPIADALAAMHALRVPLAPRGVCHGDVKPKNLLRTDATTVLLDFEHAQPIATSDAPGALEPDRFTGGSLDFAPPEAAQGKAPDERFDVYGVGATLQWITTAGGIAGLPQHPDFLAFVAACLQPDPARRPTAADAARILRELAERLAGDPHEAVLDAVARGACREPDAPPTIPGALRDGLLRFWRRRQRLLQRLPRLLAVPDALPAEPAALCREIATATRVLRRFPRHAAALRWRRELCLAAGRVIGEAAAQIANLRRSEEYDLAIQWLRETTQLAGLTQRLPGGCPIPPESAPAAVGLAHRDPVAYLKQLGEQVEAARQELAGEVETILAAERRLDLDTAEQAVEKMSASHGGSSPAVARRRDQLHRLGFYVERVARAQANVERVGTLWDAVALKPLTDFVAAAGAACVRRMRGDGPSGVVGLRSLQITLVNLSEEFPHLQQAGPALDALSEALAHLTDQGWELLAEAERCLRAVPVPVRPLQVALSRLDTYRILEAFVDRPGRPRSQLQDALESLRLRLDQARATRDRLTEGAEQAMARGHWTTGLFDMERAVAELDPIDERERAEAARLQARLAEAKRRKQEVEAAVRRNVDLATRYGTMQDDPSSSFAERLQVLAGRRDCLRMLAMHVPAERALLYGNDLRDVETQIAVEQAALAEHRLDTAGDPHDRLRIASSALDQLTASVAAISQGEEPPGRMLRLLDHWRTVTAQCHRSVEHLRDERKAERRNQRRLWSVAAGAALLSAVTIALALWPWLRGEPANAAERDRVAAAAAAMSARAAALPAALLEPARRLQATALQPATAPSFEMRTWHAGWTLALRGFVEQVSGGDDAAASRAFAVACWDAAIDAATTRLDAGGQAELATMTSALVESLGDVGIRPTRR